MQIVTRLTICIYKTLGHIPLSFHYKMGRAFSAILNACPFSPLSVSIRKRLSEVFPEASHKQLRAMEKKYYRRMCDFGAEFLSNGYKNPSPPRIVVDNVEVLEGAFTHSDFVVCYSGHFVNYEQFIQLPSLVPDVTMYNFYQPSPYKNLNDYVCRIRSREGAVLVPTNNGTRELIALKNSGCKRVVIGCLGDLPNKKNPTEINFFGKKYKAFSGTERIGKFLNAQFLYANITSNKRGEYHVRFVPMENYGKDLCHAAVENENTNMTQAFFSCLEENIRQQPELWLLWGVL